MANGDLADHIRYSAFGAILSRADSNISNRYFFTGREFDAETGLYHYRARYYDAGTGRFISEDPAGFEAGDTNLYRYVSNNRLESDR